MKIKIAKAKTIKTKTIKTKTIYMSIFLVFLIKSLLTFVFFSDNISCNRSFT